MRIAPMRGPLVGLPLAALAAVMLLASACGTRVAPVASPASPVARAPEPPAPVAPVVVPVPEDPAEALMAASARHFEAAQSELAVGHLDTARLEFDRSLDVLLEAPPLPRANPRLREQFDRLVEKISTLELMALAKGDGFTEKVYDPASIDELLAITTFPPPTPETTEAVASDLWVTEYDIDIPMNARVLAYVELFSGRLRTYLTEALGRSTRYLPMIHDIFRAEGVPLDLAYVPLVESAFKPNAFSRAKAKGLWQFMRGTALENGLKHDWYIDERSEPEKATRAAAKYLKTLYRMFGDWHLALASYNGGPGTVQRAMKRSGRDDFWKLSASPRLLPRETRDYVPLILAAVIIAKNPTQYGFALPAPPPDPPETDSVPLSMGVDLRKVAEWTGTSVETIQELNPAVRRWTTPLRPKDFELRVPRGTADAVRAGVEASDPAELAPLNWYTVKKGDSLPTIARKLKVNRTDLAEANYLSVRARVKAGQRLVVPRAPAPGSGASGGQLLVSAEPDPPPTPRARRRPARASRSTAPRKTSVRATSARPAAAGKAPVIRKAKARSATRQKARPAPVAKPASAAQRGKTAKPAKGPKTVPAKGGKPAAARPGAATPATAPRPAPKGAPVATVAERRP